MKRVVVIGLGSMGKRRIRLLKELFPDIVIAGVDSREDRRSEVAELYHIDSFSSITEVACITSVEAAFVCTSPLSHSEIITECLKNGWHVFTELNLTNKGYEDNLRLAQEKSLVLFMSSTFLYREEIRYIQSKVAKGESWNYIYHIGQYLPDWHPWENYQNFFVGDRRTNGCREIMAIELPWLTTVFGEVAKSHVVSNRITELKIDYDDNYLLMIEHKNGNKGLLMIDVVSPVAVRKLEVYTENRYISWDGTPDSLKEYDSGTRKLSTVLLSEKEEHTVGYSQFVVENAYKNEIQAFVSAVEFGEAPIYGFEQDQKVLKLIDVLEGCS